MPEQGNKHKIPHLKVSLKAFFSDMIRAKKKVIISRSGNCTMNVLSASISVEIVYLSICSRDPMKNCTRGYFYKSRYSQIHRKLQPWWLFVRWLLCSVLQVEFLIPTFRHIFCSPNPSKIYGESKFHFAK